MRKRPLSVTILAAVYIAAGAIGFFYHVTDFITSAGFPYEMLWVELVRLVAIVCGVFMLRGHNWARWVALAWMGLHVILSAFHTVPELAMHCLFFAVIAWFLMRPNSARYFGRLGAGPHGFDQASR